MRRLLRLFLLSALLCVGLKASSLPNEIASNAGATFELLRDGKPAGHIELAAGEKLSVIDLKDRYVLVRYRNLNGRMLISETTLPPNFAAPVAATEANAVSSIPPAGPTPLGAKSSSSALATTTAGPYSPATSMEQVLADKLVSLDGGALRPYATSRLAGVKFYAIYFSAGWCPPCREFTPEFMDAYTKLRAIYPEFEVVLVNRDRSPAAMFEYMRDDKMAWPALRWDQVRGAQELNRYAGAGIPCLVLVDETGKVLSDSYRWGSYVGPDAVLDDTWKLLRDYRRKNPRPKTE